METFCHEEWAGEEKDLCSVYRSGAGQPHWLPLTFSFSSSGARPASPTLVATPPRRGQDVPSSKHVCWRPVPSRPLSYSWSLHSSMFFISLPSFVCVLLEERSSPLWDCNLQRPRLLGSLLFIHNTTLRWAGLRKCSSNDCGRRTFEELTYPQDLRASFICLTSVIVHNFLKLITFSKIDYVTLREKIMLFLNS